MLLPVRFHSLSVLRAGSGAFDAIILVEYENGQRFSIYQENFDNELEATQAAFAELRRLQA